jgi:hypothetical protein
MTKDDLLFRQATQKEIDFYFNKVYPLQDNILEMFNNPSFYLTGGTALSRFHYQHRFSDDLDFFYDGFTYPKDNFNVSYREMINHLEKVFNNIEITIDGEFFKRLFIKQEDVPLRIEFVYENFKTVGEKKKFKNTWIDSKENICANKIGTLLDRRSVKDFIDLYFLLRDIELKQAIKWSELKRVPPDYEGLMMGVGDLLKNPHLLEGIALIVQPLDNDDFIGFTKKIIGDLLDDAKRV